MSDLSGQTFRVMGPEGSATADSNGNFNQAPKFLTNVTSKVRYRDALRRWMKMIAKFAKVDKKWAAIREGAGHVIYMACDETAQDLLKKAEASGILCLDSDSQDDGNEELIESILNVIAKDSPTESIKREVDLLTAIQQCQRKNGEAVSCFNSRFTGAVARYSNHTAGISDSTSRQFAIMMLRNAKLTPDTMNSLIFQLTSSETSSKRERIAQVSLTEAQLNLLIKHLPTVDKEGETGLNPVKLKISDAVKNMRDRRSCNVPMFKLDDASEYLSHVEDAQQTTQDQSNIGERIQKSMLGKRSTMAQQGRTQFISKLKEESTCRACGQKGHWYKDREKCREKIMKKRRFERNSQRATMIADDAPPTADDEKQETAVKSLFRQ